MIPGLGEITERVAYRLNPVFDVYRVSDTFPNLCALISHILTLPSITLIYPGSVLGFPRSTQEFIYFNRTDVQDAIHAPHINWMSCTNTDVYINATTGRGGNDQSIPSMLSVMPNVIDKSVRTVVVHGLAVCLFMRYWFCGLLIVLVFRVGLYPYC